VKTTLKYIELKTGYSDNGPAWIASVAFSKSGQTIYFDGKAFLKMGGSGVEGGNYVEKESGQEYWISGPKKDGSDRLHSRSGKVLVQTTVVEEYLEWRGISELDTSKYERVTIENEPYNSVLNEAENRKLEDN
jgi:hypothetical protein